MARAKWKKSPNADLVKAVQDHTDQIIEFYERVEDERPVIVLDFQKQTICAYHYEEYRVILSCGPTTHRVAFSDNASRCFPLSQLTTHRGGWWRN